MKFFLYLILLSGSVPVVANISSNDFETLSGSKVVLKVEKPKQLVIFWATWCSECKSKLKNELVTLNQRSDVEVITINVDSSADRAQHFVDEQKIALPVYRHPSKALQKTFAIYSVPHWVVYQDNQVKDQSGGFDIERINKALH